MASAFAPSRPLPILSTRAVGMRGGSPIAALKKKEPTPLSAVVFGHPQGAHMNIWAYIDIDIYIYIYIYGSNLSLWVYIYIYMVQGPGSVDPSPPLGIPLELPPL